MPVRTILISIWGQTFEDTTLLGNSRNLRRGAPEGPYEFIGADSDRRVPAQGPDFQGTRFGFNFFRLGDLANSEQPNSDFQRRIVIVNGSNSELLFSLTPVGQSDIVRFEVSAQRETILNAINSVEFAVDEVLAPIEILGSGRTGNTFFIEFTNNPGATGFEILGSPDLEEGTSQNFTSVAEISETSPGVFRAEIELTGVASPQMFFWLTR